MSYIDWILQQPDQKDWYPYQHLWYNEGVSKAYLGIDYGRVRIGLAISETGQIARPLGVIQNKGDRKNTLAIKELCEKHDIKCIVFGLPLHADGNETEMSAEVRRFGELLNMYLGDCAKVVFQNERYSSIEAQQHIRAQKSKNSVDAVAAAMVLQSYLDSSPSLEGVARRKP